MPSRPDSAGYITDCVNLGSSPCPLGEAAKLSEHWLLRREVDLGPLTEGNELQTGRHKGGRNVYRVTV